MTPHVRIIHPAQLRSRQALGSTTMQSSDSYAITCVVNQWSMVPRLISTFLLWRHEVYPSGRKQSSANHLLHTQVDRLGCGMETVSL